jgi:hypothetical protein
MMNGIVQQANDRFFRRQSTRMSFNLSVVLLPDSAATHANRVRVTKLKVFEPNWNPSPMSGESMRKCQKYTSLMSGDVRATGYALIAIF